MSAHTTPPSLIVAMHDQYEIALRNSEQTSKWHEAIADAAKEVDALRIAILYQVPNSASEAMIVQYHLVSASDVIDNCVIEPGDPITAARDVAIRTMTDFLWCEMPVTQQPGGVAIASQAERLRKYRRVRTGEPEEAA